MRGEKADRDHCKKVVNTTQGMRKAVYEAMGVAHAEWADAEKGTITKMTAQSRKRLRVMFPFPAPGTGIPKRIQRRTWVCSSAVHPKAVVLTAHARIGEEIKKLPIQW